MTLASHPEENELQSFDLTQKTELLGKPLLGARTAVTLNSTLIPIYRFRALLFVVAILLPGLIGLTGLHQDFDQRFERRLPAAFPPVGDIGTNLSRFTGELEKFVSDHIAFRDGLVRGNAALGQILFGVSLGDRVAFGPQGWLFASKIDTQIHLGLVKLSVAQQKAWHDAIERRATLAAAHGAVYRFVPAPSKQQIYPEMVPANLGRKAKETVWNQFAECCGTLPEVVLVDRTLLRHKRENQRLYYKTDLHWNQLGSFYAAQAIVDNLHQTQPEIQPLSLKDMTTTPTVFRHGSDANETALPELYSEPEQTLQPKQLLHFSPVEKGKIPARAESAEIATGPVKNGMTVLLIHDSFGDHWPTFLPMSFQTVVGVTTRNVMTDAEIARMIDTFKPNVVIEEIVMNKLTLDPDKPANISTGKAD